MAMSIGGASGGVMCDINTTPLIDVMLVLLVTLIVSLPIMTHAVKLDMPQNQPPPPENQRPEVIDLEIDFDGTVVWNGTVVNNVNQLEGYFNEEAKKDPQPEIHLRPDRRVRPRQRRGGVGGILIDRESPERVVCVRRCAPELIGH